MILEDIAVHFLEPGDRFYRLGDEHEVHRVQPRVARVGDQVVMVGTYVETTAVLDERTITTTEGEAVAHTVRRTFVFPNGVLLDEIERPELAAVAS